MELVTNENVIAKGPKEKFLEHFQQVDFTFDSVESAKVREQAKLQLEKLDFPGNKTEYWKYTKVNPIIKEAYAINASQVDADISVHDYPSGIQLVFVNGFYRKDLSRLIEINGLKVCPLSKAKEQFSGLIGDYFDKSNNADIFKVLNSAYHNDGLFLHVDKNCKIDAPIHILHLLDGNKVLAQPRNLLIAAEGSEVKIIESFEVLSGSNSFINSLSEFQVHANAKLEFNKIQNLGPENSQIATELVEQAGSSRFSITTFSLSGKLIRNNLNVSLNKENATCELNGLYLAKGKQHVDNHTIIDHKAPHCESFEIYKGILNENSTGVFNGRVLVRQAAQKTNAFQSNANVLLTDNAVVNSKPELEIYADDVKCSHGSTTGQLDDEALFYLQARGIEKEKARNLLLNAFAGEVLGKSTIQPVKDKIGNYIARRYQNPF